jgi:hypothetical protein
MDGRTLSIERFVAKTPWRPSERARERMRRVESPRGGTISARARSTSSRAAAAIRIKADKAALTQLPTRFLAVSGEATLEADDSGLVAGAPQGRRGWVGALAERAAHGLRGRGRGARLAAAAGRRAAKEPMRSTCSSR